MALVESLAINVGGAVARGLLNLLPAELRWTAGPLANVAEDGAKELTSFREKRRIQRQIEGVEELVAEKLTDVIMVEFSSLQENERIAAVDAAGITLKSIDGMRRETLFEVGLDPEGLRQFLLKKDKDRTKKSLLSEQATELYHLVIREACNYLISLVQKMSGWEKALMGQIYRKEMELVTLSKSILDRIPERDGELVETEEARLQYLRDLTRRLDTVRIYGLDVPHAYRSYALDTSWIDLRGVWVSGPKGGPRSLAMIEMFAAADRVIVQGPAGSGKTTLVRWLAVALARSMGHGALRDWNGLTPVYIPVRKVMREGEVLSLEAVMHQMSPNRNLYIDGMGAAGPANSTGILFLLDGLDEISEDGREQVLRWVEDQLERYPDCKFIITTRPPTVGAGWAARNGFHIAEILPLTPRDMEALVRRWYGTQAARDGLDEDDRMALSVLRDSLLLHLENSPTAQDLAKTPLLCALLCALNLDRKGLLPSDRLDLYRVALSSLLLRRDAERMVEWTTHSPLSTNDMESLLEALAWWMSLNDRASISPEEFAHVIGTRLPYLRNVTADAKGIGAFLLLRSGVLRSPDELSVDFIHKSFQEFLAAKAAVDGHHLDLLVTRATSEIWFTTIAMACGHANSVQREQLLKGLLDAGDTAAESGSVGLPREHAVAALCLQYAAIFDPQLVKQIEVRLNGLVPPRGASEMSLLIAAGRAAVELIAQYIGPGTALPDVVTCVTVLRAVGGDHALQTLVQIAAWFGQDEEVLIALIDAALSYDKRSYVEAVFERDLKRDFVSGLSPEQATVAELIPWLVGYGMEQILFHTDSASETGGATTYEKATQLRLQIHGALDLSALQHFPRVEDVTVQGASSLRSYAGLQRCPRTKTLLLNQANTMASLSLIALPQLESVAVSSGSLSETDCEALTIRGVLVQ